MLAVRGYSVLGNKSICQIRAVDALGLFGFHGMLAGSRRSLSCVRPLAGMRKATVVMGSRLRCYSCKIDLKTDLRSCFVQL